MSPPTMAVTGADLAAALAFSAFASDFLASFASWAAVGQARPNSPAASARARRVRSVLIRRPPVNEREPQATGGVERVAGEEHQVGRLARLDGAVRIV